MRSAEPALPLVYLPGASGSAAVWRSIAERLARRRAPHLIDYPGLSAAPAPANVDSLDELAHHLVATLPERFDAVALSMGGALALRIALPSPRSPPANICARISPGRASKSFRKRRTISKKSFRICSRASSKLTCAAESHADQNCEKNFQIAAAANGGMVWPPMNSHQVTGLPASQP